MNKGGGKDYVGVGGKEEVDLGMVLGRFDFGVEVGKGRMGKVVRDMEIGLLEVVEVNVLGVVD